MNQKEIKELIEFLVEKDIAEFELQRGDMKLLIKRGASAQPAQVVQVAPAMERIVKAEAVAMRVTLAVLLAEIRTPGAMTGAITGAAPRGDALRAVADSSASE